MFERITHCSASRVSNPQYSWTAYSSRQSHDPSKHRKHIFDVHGGRALYYISIVKPTRCTNVSNYFILE